MKIDSEKYLDSSEYIDWKHPLIAAKAAELAEGCLNDEAVAKRCFEFVRDAIKHSWDYRMNPVTCKASDVLIHGTRLLLCQEPFVGRFVKGKWHSCRTLLPTVDDRKRWPVLLSSWLECGLSSAVWLVSN